MVVSMIFIITISSLFILYFCVYLIFHSKVFHINKIPPRNTILVLGAGLEKSFEPSDILKDRLISAMDLINKTAAIEVIVSGATTHDKRSEPQVMASFLEMNKIPSSLIEIDDQGWSTFDSLVNLKISDIQDNITIISQQFHLFRALMIAKLLGLDCIGLAAENLNFSILKTCFWYLREIIATPVNIGKFLIYQFEIIPDES